MHKYLDDNLEKSNKYFNKWLQRHPPGQKVNKIPKSQIFY